MVKIMENRVGKHKEVHEKPKEHGNKIKKNESSTVKQKEENFFGLLERLTTNGQPTHIHLLIMIHTKEKLSGCGFPMLNND